MKKLIQMQRNDQGHWVGDGFPVRSIFSYHDLAKDISPFLLMDYAGPVEFPPTTKKLGVGEHPHRGFETVTVVYAGEVEHRDSSGGGGVIGAGDVQWMTAASGIVHEEFHGRNFAKTGGPFEMIQLWVNLPARAKMSTPRYQAILKTQIPVVDLPEGAGTLRIIAGEAWGARGPAKTFTPVNLWDGVVKAGKRVSLTVPGGHTASLFVRRGGLVLEGGKTLREGDIGVFDTEGSVLSFQASEDAVMLFLGGEPLNEPIVGYGPFVMNTESEIRQAFLDYRAGKMGSMG
jgi:hypothetical protein